MMAAGQGFKTFTTGEVLTAGDVNGYLMQGINVFTNATARDAAITAPAEGQFAFTKDNNSLWYYDGAAWVASGATGDIEGVTVTSPLTGGGTSGTVTVGILSGTTSNLGAVQLSDSTSSTSTTLAATANAVKTTYDLAAAAIPKSTVTTAGDIIYATGSSAVTRAGIGSTGQVLTVAGGVPTWATPASSTPTAAGTAVYLQSSQSIANNTDTFIGWDSESFDTDGYHDNATNNSRFTVPAGKAGKYLITCQVQFGSSAVGNRFISVAKNGATGGSRLSIFSFPAQAGEMSVAISFVVNAAVGDYYGLYVAQTSGGSLNINGNSANTMATTASFMYLGA